MPGVLFGDRSGQQRGAYTLPDHFPDSKAIRYFHDDVGEFQIVVDRVPAPNCGCLDHHRQARDHGARNRIGEVCGQANGDRQDCFLGAHGNFSKPVGDFGTRVGLEKPEFTRTCSDERAHVLCVGGGVRGEPNSGCRQMEASGDLCNRVDGEIGLNCYGEFPRRAKRLPQPPRPRPSNVGEQRTGRIGNCQSDRGGSQTASGALEECGSRELVRGCARPARGTVARYAGRPRRQ